ncbi:MAG: pseudouridine synthase [Lachnospiraceae bacterium]|nr:pseudouridine synthase [Lachnospiraceae bacterium]
MRLDKFLTEMNIGTRSEVKQLLKKQKVRVNGMTVTRPEMKIDPDLDQVCYDNRILQYEKYVYYMLHKPAGVVSATEDAVEQTVVDLLAIENCKGLFPVGRLDKDTEGLLLLTNDGAFAHSVLSPKKHVQKCYYAILDKSCTDAEVHAFWQGLDIKDDKLTLPAILKPLSKAEHERYQSQITTPAYASLTGYGALVWITEGRYHQVKRMFAVFQQEVLYLKRLSMGALMLDEGLPTGSYGKLSKEVAEKALLSSEVRDRNISTEI